MNPVSVFPAIATILVALSTCWLIARRFGPPSNSHRYSSIDGLRGYLALFVFLHHSSIWYFYLKVHRWENPPSNFGQSGVALFFMITGFLFFSKLIDRRSAGALNWRRLFISRVLRLTPLYLFAMALLFGIVIVLSNGILNIPLATLAIESLSWITFTMFGGPDLNAVAGTSIIVAGVTWSLPYEWIFYCSLPLMALVMGIRPSLPYLLVALGAGLVAVLCDCRASIFSMFLGGILASLLVRLDVFVGFAKSGVASMLAIVSLATAIGLFSETYGISSFVLLTIFFCIVAGGNTLFGTLGLAVSRTLGEMAYSIYLLHGILLFVAFHFVLGTSTSRALSPVQHWLVVTGLVPILVSSCFATFVLIERPAMRRTDDVARWIDARAARLFKRGSS